MDQNSSIVRPSHSNTVFFITLSLLAGIVIGNMLPQFMSPTGRMQGAVYQTEKDNRYLDPKDSGASSKIPAGLTLDTYMTPQGMVQVDNISDTEDVLVLRGTIRGKNMDLDIDSIPVFIATNETDIDNVINTATLKLNGATYVESVVTSRPISKKVVVFDNLGYQLPANTLVSFEVTVDFNDVEPPMFDEGSTIVARVDVIHRNAIDVVNAATGNALLSTERDGTIIGSSISAHTIGMNVEFISASQSVTHSIPVGTDAAAFEIEFKVTAFGDDVYIDSSIIDGYTLSINNSGVPLSSIAPGAMASVLTSQNGNTPTQNGNYKIEEGQPEIFTLASTIQRPQIGPAGYYSLHLKSIKWGINDSISLPNSLPVTMFTSAVQLY